MAPPIILARLALAMALLFGLAAPGGAEPRRPAGAPRIDVIFSYSPAHPGTKAALEVVHERLGPRYEIFESFLDTKRHAPKNAFAHLERLIRDKHREGPPPALVLTFDDNAVIFAERHREALFGGAPIVFAGVNARPRAEAMAALPGVTGVYESLAIGRTIALAQTLNRARLRRIVAIVDDSTTSQSLDAMLSAEEGDFPSLTFERLALHETTFADAALRLSEERRLDTAFLYLAAHRDGRGESMSGAPRFLQRRAARPLYALTERVVRGSVTAGHVAALDQQARIAVAMAERVLQGDSPDAIPAVYDSPTIAAVDAVRARRFDLRLETLPENALVHRRAPSFWDGLAALSLVAAILTGGAAAVLALFLIANERARRRLSHVNEALRERHEELVAAKQEIERQSLQEPLTLLPNRRSLERRMAEVGALASDGGVWALLHLDLDRFKSINDSFGRRAGDHTLRIVAERLRALAPPEGFVACDGGDEFFCLARFDGRVDVESCAERLRTELSAPVTHEGISLRFGVSIGAAIIDLADPGALERSFQKADIALHRSKTEGRGRVSFFSSAHATELALGKELEDDVARGLEAGEFAPWYQPQICAETGAAVGVEALARWRHPERGMLTPAAFMEAVHSLGAGGELDRKMLQAVCRDLALWRAEGVAPQSVSVNISPRRLTDPDMAKEILACDLGETRLSCELLESIFLDGGDAELDWAIDQLRDLNVDIEIDDFGTGHASIMSLLNLRPDRLKIARELIGPIDASETRLELVRAIMAIAKSLGVHVVAEGVERAEHIRLLRALGCERLQGWAVSPPLPPSEIPSFFQKRATRAA